MLPEIICNLLQVGLNAFRLARQFVDKVVTVRENYIALAMLRLLELEKNVVEGTLVFHILRPPTVYTLLYCLRWRSDGISSTAARSFA